jgi:hypothetical protein
MISSLTAMALSQFGQQPPMPMARIHRLQVSHRCSPTARSPQVSHSYTVTDRRRPLGGSGAWGTGSGAWRRRHAATRQASEQWSRRPEGGKGRPQFGQVIVTVSLLDELSLGIVRRRWWIERPPRRPRIRPGVGTRRRSAGVGGSTNAPRPRWPTRPRRRCPSARGRSARLCTRS